MILDRGSDEIPKVAAHVLLGSVAAVCALYNVAAWLWRRERHLAINAVIYGALTALECYQIQRHGRP